MDLLIDQNIWSTSESPYPVDRRHTALIFFNFGDVDASLRCVPFILRSYEDSIYEDFFDFSCPLKWTWRNLFFLDRTPRRSKNIPFTFSDLNRPNRKRIFFLNSHAKGVIIRSFLFREKRCQIECVAEMAYLQKVWSVWFLINIWVEPKGDLGEMNR